MFTSNSYLAPDTGKRRKFDPFTEIWKAESYINERKITDEQKKIDWFLRGSPDYVIKWYIYHKNQMSNWKIFQSELIKEFGSEESKEAYLFSAYQDNDESVGEFTRRLLSVANSKKDIEIRNIFDIIVGIKDEQIRKEFRKQMWKRPKRLPHWIWLSRVITKYENTAKLHNKKNKSDSNHDLKDQELTIEKACAQERIRTEGRSSSTSEYQEKDTCKNTANKQMNNMNNASSERPEVVCDTKDTKVTNKSTQTSDRELKVDKEEQYRNDLLNKLIKEYPNVTDNTVKERPPCPLIKCEIKTPEGKRVSVKGKRRFEQSILSKAREELKNLQTSKIISQSNSDWRSPMTPVLKPNGNVRICVNYIALNELVEKVNYETPIMDDLIEKVQGSQWLTVIDLKDGYFQIEIAERDRYKTAFKFDNMIYEWNRMPMGFTNAPGIFQEAMDKLFNDLTDQGVEVYLDDIVIYSKTKKEHERLLKEVFKRFERNNLYINIKKLQLAQKEITFLGRKVNGETQKLLHEGMKDIEDYPRPTNVKSLRRFLGKMNFYSPFIKNMSTIAVPLYEKTGKYAKFIWTDQMEESFNTLKVELSKTTSLYLPDYKKKFILETDASDTGLGACLMQKDNKNNLVPIRWASRKLSKSEKNYGITEKEFLAIIWGIEYFEYQLKGREFDIITDHIALTSIRTKGDFGNARMNKWIDSIQKHQFTVIYKKGQDMLSADAMSRLYENEKENTSGEEETKKKAIIKEIHERLLHRGLDSVKHELEQNYRWDNTTKLIQEIIKDCEVCSRNNRKHSGGSELVQTTERLEKTAIDIMKLGEYGMNVLVFIDYYSRLTKLRKLENRTTKEITKKLKEIFYEIGRPKQLNSDNAKEFASKEFFNFMTDNNIEHHLTSVEHHSSNGRVERVIRTIRDAIVKTKSLEMSENKLIDIETKYNDSYHKGIGMTPMRAFNQDDKETKEIISKTNRKYTRRFKKRKREKFIDTQPVLISEKENLKDKGKSHDRFQNEGIIVRQAGTDSYLVRDNNNNLTKIAHCDLKAKVNA